MKRFSYPGNDGERHDGYSFDLPGGQRCEVPAETVSSDKYRNAAMTRDEAYDIAIAFGLATGMPAVPRRCGEGYSVEVPAEYLRGLLESIGKLPL